MKRIIITLVLLGGIINPFYSQSSSFKDTTANITGWNLAGFHPIPSKKAADFANAITYFDPEVLALVEVNPDDFIDKIIAELKKLGKSYKGVILDQTSKQNIAIIYKDGVELSNLRLIDGSDNDNRYLRKALVADVKIGGFDFILITLHLKSAREKEERETRDEQTKAIATFIKNTTESTEKDVLVVGDYNMVTGDDQSNFTNMNPTNYLNFVSDSLKGQFTHISPSGKKGRLLDGYAISKDYTNEYVIGSIRIIPLHKILGLSLLNFRRNISDHLPVDAIFRITDDDD